MLAKECERADFFASGLKILKIYLLKHFFLLKSNVSTANKSTERKHREIPELCNNWQQTDFGESRHFELYPLKCNIDTQDSHVWKKIDTCFKAHDFWYLFVNFWGCTNLPQFFSDQVFVLKVSRSLVFFRCRIPIYWLWIWNGFLTGLKKGRSDGRLVAVVVVVVDHESDRSPKNCLLHLFFCWSKFHQGIFSCQFYPTDMSEQNGPGKALFLGQYLYSLKSCSCALICFLCLHFHPTVCSEKSKMHRYSHNFALNVQKS